MRNRVPKLKKRRKCLIGTTTQYHWGDEFNSSKANNGNKMVPVGQYGPNRFGLCDMHG